MGTRARNGNVWTRVPVEVTGSMSPSCSGGIGRGHTVGEHERGLGRGGGLRGLEHRVYNFSVQFVGN